MDENPIIVMQCPKCKREFSLDTNYCEDCTAMLEPTEREQTPPEQPKELTAGPTAAARAASDEQLEDFRIDSLKTDIEESFITTLLYELQRLRKRILKKEASLSGLQAQQTDRSNPELIREIGKAEDEVNEVLRRTAKIEAILENLKKKLEADIDSLQEQLQKAERPGLFGFLSATGRYFHMLSSEIALKRALLTAIETKQYRKRRVLLRYAAVFVTILVIASLLTYAGTRVYQKDKVIAPSAASRGTASVHAVEARDIYDLLEDIKNANIKKDLGLWESRYSRQYLEAGRKKEDTAGTWKKFDFLSLQYKVSDIRMLPGEITAVISWDMELRSKESGRVSRSVQTLLSTFIVEDNKLRIASVRKTGQ